MSPRNLNKPAALYARVSTIHQRIEPQIARLEDYAKNAGFSRMIVFSDLASGRDTARPGLKSLLEAVTTHRVGAVVVESLERLGRSVRDVIFLCEQFQRYGVEFISTRQAIDTSSPAGKFFFHVMTALAELEREMIAERVKAGLQTARTKGIDLGRPRIPSEIRSKIRELRSANVSLRRIALLLEISPTTVKKYLKA